MNKIEHEEKIFPDTGKQIHESDSSALKSITDKIERYLRFVEGSIYMRATRHREFGYPKKNWPRIDKLFADLPEMLVELYGDQKVQFAAKSSLDHILGNYGLMGQRSVEGRRMERNIIVGVPMSPGIQENMRDLSEEDFRVFQGFKDEWDLILYYLELIENNPEILAAEVASEEGWLAEYKNYFQENKIPVLEVKDHLRLVNFFARLQDHKSELAEVRGLKDLAEPINEENFKNEFNQLPKHELLDKQSIKDYFFETKYHQQAA